MKYAVFRSISIGVIRQTSQLSGGVCLDRFALKSLQLLQKFFFFVLPKRSVDAEILVKGRDYATPILEHQP